MKPADYQCPYCNNVFEHIVSDMEPIPETIQCRFCPMDAKRKFTPVSHICHQGKAGNYKNGYTSNPVGIKKT